MKLPRGGTTRGWPPPPTSKQILPSVQNQKAVSAYLPKKQYLITLQVGRYRLLAFAEENREGRGTMVIACHPAVFGCIRSRSAWKQLRLLMTGWALPMSLPVVQFWTPLGAEFLRNIIVFQYLDFVSLLCRWARHFTLTCFTWLRCKWVPDRTEMAMCIVRYVQCTEMATGLIALHGVKMAHECTSPVTTARDIIRSRLMSLQTLYQNINLYCYLYRPKMYEGWSRSLIRLGCDSLSRGTGSFVIVVMLQTPRRPGMCSSTIVVLYGTLWRAFEVIQ